MRSPRNDGRAAERSLTGGHRRRSTTPTLPVGGTSATTLRLQSLFARAFAWSSVLRRKMKNAGDVADFVDWQLDQFGTSHIHSSREDLWKALMRRLDPSEPLTVLEFGVAWGYSTQWWLAHLDDPDAVWQVGDVEDTLAEIPPDDLERTRRLVLFDLDIYEPTVVAWNHVAPWLQAGDLLYFDEAMDDDERKVLDELVLPTGAVEYIGATASGLALVVTRPVPPLS